VGTLDRRKGQKNRGKWDKPQPSPTFDATWRDWNGHGSHPVVWTLKTTDAMVGDRVRQNGEQAPPEPHDWNNATATSDEHCAITWSKKKRISSGRVERLITSYLRAGEKRNATAYLEKRLQEDDERKLPRTRWPIPRHDTITLQKPNERKNARANARANASDERTHEAAIVSTWSQIRFVIKCTSWKISTFILRWAMTRPW